jgi:hypothetical protein
VNKEAKYMRRPRIIHFEALLHVLRYLRDNNHSDSPQTTLDCHYGHIYSLTIPMDQLIAGMSDSSRNYGTAGAEYNQACIATMTLLHVSMAIKNFEVVDEDHPRINVPLIMDRSSAIAIGSLFHNTKHTRYFMMNFHFVCTTIDKNFVIPPWIPTKVQLADLGTKSSKF